MIGFKQMWFKLVVVIIVVLSFGIWVYLFTNHQEGDCKKEGIVDGQVLIYNGDYTNQEESREAIRLQILSTLEKRLKSFKVCPYSIELYQQDSVKIVIPNDKYTDDIIRVALTDSPVFDIRVQNPNPPPAPVGDQTSIDPSSLWLPTGLSGARLSEVTADIQQGAGGNNQVVVRLQFDDEGTKLFSDLTTSNIGKQIAIFLDGQILSAPTVQTAITNGEAIITGNFTADTAKELANRLNSGTLPVPIKLLLP